jgi:uncharacterized protein
VAVWLTLFVCGVAASILDGATGKLAEFSHSAPPIAYCSLALLAMALGCEFMDATIGMGYGTTLTPVLLIMGSRSGRWCRPPC